LLASPTEWSHAVAHQLLNRYGVLTRESVAAENLPAGFSAIYDVLKALEESGRIRRGYFVAGLGATQFALPAAVDLLRSLRTGPPLEKPEMVTLAATDPANLYGSVLRWPAAATLTRSAGASVVLRNGELVAYLRRNNPSLQVFLPGDEPERSTTARDLSVFLAGLAQQDMERREDQRGGMLISTINGQPAAQDFLALFLQDAGFHLAPQGLNFRRALHA
jgi:ATP-dependent Lhr-like helicase